MRGGPWAGSSGADRWLRGEGAQRFAEELVLKTQVNTGFSAGTGAGGKSVPLTTGSH